MVTIWLQFGCNLVTIFAYIIEKTVLRIFSEKIFSKPLDLELTPYDTIRL